MQCQQCGTPVTGNFCPNCGARVLPKTEVEMAPPGAQPWGGPAPQAPSPLQPALGIGALIISLLSLVAGAFLHLRSTQFPDPWSFEAIRYGDLAWVIFLAGGGLAILLAIAVLFIRGARRWWAIPGGVVAAATLVLGLVLAA